MIKKIIFSFIVFSCLTACTRIDPINERLIVEVIGVDYEEKKNEYKISLELYTPQGGSSPTTIDPTQSNAKLVECRGETIYEALTNATLLVGDRFFYGNTRVIILGESASKELLQELMDFLNNFSEISANVKIVTTKGTASDLLKTDIKEGITPGEAISHLLKNSRFSGKSVDFSFLEFTQAYLSRTLSPVLPVIKLTKKESKSEGSSSSAGKGESTASSETLMVSPLTLNGTAVFYNKKLTDYLNESETRGLTILRNKIESTNYKAKIDKLKQADISLYQIKSKIKIENVDGKINAKITVKSQGDIKAYTFSEGVDGLKDDDIRQLEQEVKNQLKSDCEAVLNKSLKELHVDLFRFGDKLWKKDPKCYTEVIDDYDNFLNELEVTLDIEVNINRIGLENILK